MGNIDLVEAYIPKQKPDLPLLLLLDVVGELLEVHELRGEVLAAVPLPVVQM